MNGGLYQKVEQFVVDSFTKAGIEKEAVHANRTVYWIKQLKTDVDEALLVAGLAHDIERAFYGDWKKGSADPELLRKHQDLSAAEIVKFLKTQGADEKFIALVRNLVLRHETGGNEDENVLCDADCLAFLEEKAPRLALKARQAGDIEEAERRMRMVFDRVHLLKAKQIAQKFFDKAMNVLN